MPKASRLDSFPDLANIIAQSKTWRELGERLGYSHAIGFLALKIRRLGFDTSHFVRDSWSTGRNRFNDNRVARRAEKLELPWSDAFRKGSGVKNSQLMRRLLFSGKRQYVCEKCGISNWQGQPLRLQLDHIDGDNTNAEETNLRFLCPNCHTQTATFGRKKTKQSVVKFVYEHAWWRQLSMGLTEDIKALVNAERLREAERIPEEYFCDCGNKKVAQSNHCLACEYKNRQGCERPKTRKFDISSEELKKLVWEMPTEKVAKLFGVSDKAIEKRCKKYNIEKPPRGYWAKKQAGVL